MSEYLSVIDILKDVRLWNSLNLNKEIVIQELELALKTLAPISFCHSWEYSPKTIPYKAALSRLRFCIEALKSDGKDTIRLEKERTDV